MTSWSGPSLIQVTVKKYSFHARLGPAIQWQCLPSPSPDLLLCDPILPRVLFSRGMFLLTDTSMACFPTKSLHFWVQPLVNIIFVVVFLRDGVPKKIQGHPRNSAPGRSSREETLPYPSVLSRHQAGARLPGVLQHSLGPRRGGGRGRHGVPQ